MPQKRVGLAHPGEHGNGGKPEDDSDEDAPPCGNRKCEARAGQSSKQDEFPVTTEDQVRAIRRLMNHGLPWRVLKVHLDQCSGDTKGAAQDVCCKHKDGDDESQ